MQETISNSVFDSRARRAAAKVGLTARKSRRAISLDNLGGYMLVDPHINGVVAGSHFDLEPEAVIEYCCELKSE